MPDTTLITRKTSITVTDAAGVLVTPIAVTDDGLYVREIRIMGTDTIDSSVSTVEVLVVRLESSEKATIELGTPASQF